MYLDRWFDLAYQRSFFFTDPYYSHLTKGIAQVCNQYDYTLALFLIGSKEDEKNVPPCFAKPVYVFPKILPSSVLITSPSLHFQIHN